MKTAIIKILEQCSMEGQLGIWDRASDRITQEFIKTIDEMIIGWDKKFPHNDSDALGAQGFDAGYKAALTELKQKIEEK